MRVPKDYRAGVGEASVKALASALLAPRVVDHRDPRATEFELQGLGEIQIRRVHVTLDGAYGSIKGHLVQERRLQQVPCV